MAKLWKKVLVAGIRVVVCDLLGIAGRVQYDPFVTAEAKISRTKQRECRG